LIAGFWLGYWRFHFTSFEKEFLWYWAKKSEDL